jgi:uncharacterized membrane protein YtjA (UPF0391 family)
MLELAIGAVVVALIAGALGFRGVSSAAATVAKVIFVMFLVAAVVLFLLLWGGVSLLR